MSASSRRQFLLTSAAATAACTIETPTPSAGTHIVLLGDSIFDNGAYVPGKPSVIEQLSAALAGAGRTTLLARDGDVCADVNGQLADVPADATHLVVSAGGNDALRNASLLDQDVGNSALLFAQLAEIHAAFRARYAAMLRAVLQLRKPTAVCTVYDSNFDAPKKQLADVALSVFNDAIIRCASDASVPVIDLRRIFTVRADYANDIEPSETGGSKMVQAIVRVAAEHDFTAQRTTMYA